MSSELPNLLEQIGLDPHDFEWRYLSACKDYPLNLFFDDYEKDKISATNVDQLCLGCPVTKECYEFGVATKSTGVFGGFFLTDGKPNKPRNAHKTQEIAAKLASKIFNE